MRIATITQKYLAEFPTDWIDKLDWSTEEKSKASFILGKMKIETFIEKSFLMFSTSVLCGEYVIKDLEPHLKEFQEILIRDYPPSRENKFQSSLYESLQDLDGDLLLIAKRYRVLIKLVADKISRTNHEYIVAAFVSGKDRCTNACLQNIIEYSFFICLKDHFLKFSNDEVKELLLAREDLKNRINQENESIIGIYKVLHDKCSFLLKKLIHIKGEAEYILNFETKSLIRDSIELHVLNKFDVHFSFLNVQENYRKDDDVINWRKNCQSRNSPFAAFILLMRFYVKNGGSRQQVDALMKDFHACIEIFNIKRRFDRYAINSLRNYMQNCYFSYLLSKYHLKYDDFEKEMSKISDLQTQTKIYNFHPYKKAVDYLLIEIERDIENNAVKKIIDRKYRLLEKYYIKLKETIKWCQGQDYYPFQLPYWECLEKATDVNLILFIPSTFTKPLNYEELEDAHAKYSMKIAAISEQLRILGDKKEILELKEQLSGHQKTYIQILGLFTAILTFLFGAINIFSRASENTSSLQEKIDDTAVIGILLLIFSSTIYLLTQPRKGVVFSFRNILFSLMIAGYFVLLYKFYS